MKIKKLIMLNFFFMGQDNILQKKFMKLVYKILIYNYKPFIFLTKKLIKVLISDLQIKECVIFIC